MNKPLDPVSISSFHRLRSINVNEHTEKKNNLTYLSWAWAVDQLLQQDPQATWEYLEPLKFGETMMVRCSVTAFSKTMTSHLPVMDHRNKAIPNPDAFQVNTAMQRCLAKAIALHGLGLYIYAGEDIPEADKPEVDDRILREAQAAALGGMDSLTKFHKANQKRDGYQAMWENNSISLKDAAMKADQELAGAM